MMLPLLAQIRVTRSTGRPRCTPGTGRNVIERAFCKCKHWRGLATRYDKHVTVYRGALVLAVALTWITDLGDTS